MADNGHSQEIQDALRKHNDVRRAAPGVPRPPLIWDKKLAADAQRYAEHLASTRQLKHSGQREQGEHLCVIGGMGDGPSQPFGLVVQHWINERRNYHGEKVGRMRKEKCGHYTQVIWPTTTYVGMGSAIAKNGGKQFFVARYYPPGNIVGGGAYTG